MENATKALVIAANVLLAVMILSLVVYFYGTWRQLPQEEDQARLVRQAQAFNKEYEAYDKKIMYGADVISAINKAISNNEKYIQGSRLSGTLSSTEFAVNFKVVLLGQLEEKVTLRYFDLAEQRRDEKEYIGSTHPSFVRTFDELEKGLADDDLVTSSPRFILPTNTYTSILDGVEDWADLRMDSQTITVKTCSGNAWDTVANVEKGSITIGETTKNLYSYRLLPDNCKKEDIVSAQNVYLHLLVSGITAFNSAQGQTINHVVHNNSLDDDVEASLYAEGTGWSSMTWKPAITDLKTRKFKCVGIDDTTGLPNGEPGIHYNEVTGAIDCLTFVEYEIPN